MSSGVRGKVCVFVCVDSETQWDDGHQISKEFGAWLHEPNHILSLSYVVCGKLEVCVRLCNYV